MYTTVVCDPGLDALVARLSGGYSASNNRWSRALPQTDGAKVSAAAAAGQELALEGKTEGRL